MKPLALTIGAAMATTLSAGSIANTETNPFAMSELSSGYMQVAEEEKSETKEGKRGGKMKEGSCSAGNCGGKMKKDAEGECGGAGMTEETEKKSEGNCAGDKCGAAKCGANKPKDDAPAE